MNLKIIKSKFAGEINLSDLMTFISHHYGMNQKWELRCLNEGFILKVKSGRLYAHDKKRIEWFKEGEANPVADLEYVMRDLANQKLVPEGRYYVRTLK